MNHYSALHAQRSTGEVQLQFGTRGVVNLREAGSAKIRIPKDSYHAILINTSGGLAGGDRVEISLAVDEGARLSVTSQAAERAYRSLGPKAEITCNFRVARGASLHWLPQETILFEGSKLARVINIAMEAESELLLVESVVLGRAAMGETIEHTDLADQWNVFQEGKLIHAERFTLGPDLRRSAAALGAAQAIATLILISPAAAKRKRLMEEAIGHEGAVSCWNGKLVARLVAEDGLTLRKALQRAMVAAMGNRPLPRVWAL